VLKVRHDNDDMIVDTNARLDSNDVCLTSSCHKHHTATSISHQLQGRNGLSGTCQVGRLVCQPGGPPRQMLK